MAPTALSSPTRRIWSATRPATSTATLATASRHSSQLATIMTSSSFLTTFPSCWLMSGHPVRNGALGLGVVFALANASARPGCASFRFRKYVSGPPVLARPRAAAPVTQTSPGCVVVSLALMMQPVKQTFGYGTKAAVTATPATRNDRPFSVIRAPAPMPSASAKLRSTTTSPGCTQFPWVSFGWSSGCCGRVPAFHLRGRRGAVGTQQRPGNRIGPAVAGDPRSVVQRGERGHLARRDALDSIGLLPGPAGKTLATTSGPRVAARVCS